MRVVYYRTAGGGGHAEGLVHNQVQVGVRGQLAPGQGALQHDPTERLRRLPRANSMPVRLLGTSLLTVRVDLDRPPR